MFSILSVVAAIGLVVFIFIIFRSYFEKRQNSSIKEKKETLADIIQTLKIAGQLLKTRNMLALLILFAYLGKILYEYSTFVLNIKHLKGYRQYFLLLFMVQVLAIIKNMEVN